MNAILCQIQIGLTHYMVLGGILFVCGLATILTKRNAIGILMGVELILNAANINLVAANHFSHASAASPQAGQVFALFVIVLAAAEAAVALAIFLNFYNNFASVDVEKAANLKG